MNKQRPLASLLLTATLSICASGLLSPNARGQSHPNVIMILADDMGYGDVSCNNPQSKIKTPRIDSIAERGIRFTDAHSGGSSCIPSRYALMTGRYAVRKPMSLAKGPLIEAQQTTVASMLKAQGYATAMVGKWHLGFDPFLQDQKNPADYSKPLTGGPVDCGFDSFFGMHASLDLPPYFYIRDRRPVMPPTGDTAANDSINGPEGWNNIQGAFWRKGKIAPDLKFDQVTPRFFAEATKVISSHDNQNGKRPLFLYLALPSPHTPWLPAKKFQGQSGAGMYGDFVLQVDEGVGQVLDAVNKAAIEDNTLVIFSSDNGPVWYDKDREKFGHDAVGGLRGMKFSSWEGGHRMPFLVRWPRLIKQPRTCEQTIVFSDVLATLAQAAGNASVPAGMAEDSVSFFPHLAEDLPPAKRPPVIHNNSAIRDGNWKLILPKGKRSRRGEPNTVQLYNVRNDIGEKTNLISQNADKAEALKQKLQSFIEAAK